MSCRRNNSRNRFIQLKFSFEFNRVVFKKTQEASKKTFLKNGYNLPKSVTFLQKADCSRLSREASQNEVSRLNTQPENWQKFFRLEPKGFQKKSDLAG